MYLCVHIITQDPRQATVKDHSALVLRAETYDQKVQWLARFRKACEPQPRKSAGANKVSLTQFDTGLCVSRHHDTRDW